MKLKLSLIILFVVNLNAADVSDANFSLMTDEGQEEIQHIDIPIRYYPLERTDTNCCLFFTCKNFSGNKVINLTLRLPKKIKNLVLKQTIKNYLHRNNQYIPRNGYLLFTIDDVNLDSKDSEEEIDLENKTIDVEQYSEDL